MSLKDDVQEVIAEYTEDPPPNESSTCEWVILPLLWAAGYARRDIVSRVADNNGQFPDYTLLPNDPERTWYLEAKAWNVTLEDKHAQQSLNYANQNGKRWVALTNGRVWRLYDNRIQGLAADKLITQVRLEEAEKFVKFLAALGKNAVCSGELERYAAKSRLAFVLNEELRKPDSEIMAGIHSLLKARFGLPEISRTDILDYFMEVLGSHGKACTQAVSSIPAVRTELRVHPDPASPIVAPALSSPSIIREGQSLEKLYQAVTNKHLDVVMGKVIESITFPDDSRILVAKWDELEVAIVKWLGDRKRLPLPFSVGRQENYLNNVREGMRQPKRVEFGWGVVFIETHTDNKVKIKRLHALCEQVGEAPTRFILKIRN